MQWDMIPEHFLDPESICSAMGQSVGLELQSHFPAQQATASLIRT